MSFSVATTSTKAPPVIKADIRRVLDRMQVQYREVKGGFECIHLPSIDLSSVLESPTPTPRQNHQPQTSSGSGDTGRGSPAVHHRPSIVKKASKLSFGIKREKGKDRDRDRDHSGDKEKDKEKEAPSRPSGATTLTATPSSGSSSFFNVSSNHTVVAQENNINGVASSPVDVNVTPQSHAQSTSTTLKTKGLPPIPRDFGGAASPRSPSPLPTGEVNQDVFESMGNNTLSVRFEINIVKVSSL